MGRCVYCNKPAVATVECEECDWVWALCAHHNNSGVGGPSIRKCLAGHKNVHSARAQARWEEHRMKKTPIYDRPPPVWDLMTKAIDEITSAVTVHRFIQAAIEETKRNKDSFLPERRKAVRDALEVAEKQSGELIEAAITNLTGKGAGPR
jgi:Fe-S cluster assembly ATPase SufC